MSPDTPSEDFDVAKSVFEQLKGLPVEHQERVLRWVAESLGVRAVPAGGQPAPTTATQAEQRLPGGTATGGAATDIKSFITNKAPQSDNQFAAAVAYYYRFEAGAAQRRDSITAKMLQDAARLAGRRRLGDPAKTLSNAKSLGYLDRPTPGEFAINSVGENLVAMTLPSGSGPSPRKTGRRAARKATTRAKSKRTPKPRGS